VAWECFPHADEEPVGARIVVVNADVSTSIKRVIFCVSPVEMSMSPPLHDLLMPLLHELTMGSQPSAEGAGKMAINSPLFARDAGFAAAEGIVGEGAWRMFPKTS
jgi:hypothetical protein